MAEAHTRLWLVRHAKVDAPVGVCYGATDLAADANHTQRCAEQLATVLPAGLAVRVSGLRRTQQLLAGVQGYRPDLSAPLVDLRLNEMDFGAWEMQPWNTLGPTRVDAWLADFPDHRCGGGESVRAVLTRVEQALIDHVRQARDAVWFTHAGVVRAVFFLLQRSASDRFVGSDWPTLTVAPGGCLHVDVPRRRYLP